MDWRLSRWVQCNHMGPLRVREIQWKKRQNRFKAWQRLFSLLLPLKMEGTTNQKMWVLLGAEFDIRANGKQGNRASVLQWHETKFYQQPEWAWKWLLPQRPTLLVSWPWLWETCKRETSGAHRSSDLQDCKIVLFEAGTFMVICYSRNINRMQTKWVNKWCNQIWVFFIVPGRMGPRFLKGEQ